MAGYSGTPLPCKLGIKPGHRVGVEKAGDRVADAAERLGDWLRAGRGGSGAPG